MIRAPKHSPVELRRNTVEPPKRLPAFMRVAFIQCPPRALSISKSSQRVVSTFFFGAGRRHDPGFERKERRHDEQTTTAGYAVAPLASASSSFERR